MTYHQTFEKRLRTNAAEPLLTWYEVTSGARVELSGQTFGNWVDKCSHLLVEEIDPQPGDTVAMPLLQDRPGHWMTLVMVAACWHLGLAVTVDADADTVLIVGGPGIEADEAGLPTWAVSLHPLGMGLSEVSPGVLDWAGEVRSYPDLHLPPVVDAAVAWRDPDIRFAELTVNDPAPRRTLVRAADPWTTVQSGLVEPILTGGSVVLVEGPASAEDVQAIATSERATPTT